MIFFVIQKRGEYIDSDTATLIESIRYQEFIGNSDYQFMFVKQVLSYKTEEIQYIPIGTIEFVEEFIKKNNLNTSKFKPIHVKNKYYDDVKIVDNLFDLFIELDKGAKFVKPFSTFKSNFSDENGYIFTVKDLNLFQDGEIYFVRPIYNILSEYRIFVYFNQIKGVYNYSGDILKFINEDDLSVIKDMIKELDIEGLNAYTLDIALTDKGTKLLEVHPFFSCGLYGFNDYKCIPQMYISGYNYLTRN